MIRWLLWGFAGLLLGVLVHLVTIIALPRLSGQTGVQRAISVAAPAGFVILPADKSPLPLPDPAVVTGLCRYDLAAGPAQVHVPVTASFVSVSFYTPAGLNFYALTDRAAANGALDLKIFTPAQLAEIRAREGPDMPGDLRLQSPQSTGLVVLRALVPEPGAQEDIEGTLAGARCEAIRP